MWSGYNAKQAWLHLGSVELTVMGQIGYAWGYGNKLSELGQKDQQFFSVHEKVDWEENFCTSESQSFIHANEFVQK